MNNNVIIIIINSFFDKSNDVLLPFPKMYVITFIVINIIDKNCIVIINMNMNIFGNVKTFNKNIISSINLNDNGSPVKINHIRIIRLFNFGIVVLIPNNNFVFLVLNLIYIISFKKNNIILKNVCRRIKYNIIFKFIKLL